MAAARIANAVPGRKGVMTIPHEPMAGRMSRSPRTDKRWSSPRARAAAAIGQISAYNPGLRRHQSGCGPVKMKIRAKKFRAGEEVDLRQWPTRIAPVYESKEDYGRLLADHVARLSKQQELLYAAHRHALLLIFQAMDAAGKDGAIKHVMSGVNPQGCQVFSFKHPSAEEL